MAYDKESLLAGISIGTQLKGWASYPSEILSRYGFRSTRLWPNPPMHLASTTGNVPIVPAISIYPLAPMVLVKSVEVT